MPKLPTLRSKSRTVSVLVKAFLMSLNTSEYNITRLIIVSIEIYSCSESKKKPPVVAVMAPIPLQSLGPSDLHPRKSPELISSSGSRLTKLGAPILIPSYTFLYSIYRQCSKFNRINRWFTHVHTMHLTVKINTHEQCHPLMDDSPSILHSTTPCTSSTNPHLSIT